MTTQMQQVEDGQAGAAVIVNENFYSLSALAIYSRKPDTTAGLVLGYYGGSWGDDTVVDGTIELAPGAVNYVVRDRATGELSTSTDDTDWEDVSNFSRIGIGTTGPVTITGWDDRRAGPGGLFSSSEASALADGDYGDIVVSGGGTVMDIDPGVLSAFGRTFINDADAAAARTTLGVDAAIAAAVAGLSWKQAVRAATTAAGTLATGFENGDTIDGVTLATGDRILIKNQSTASENGIYVVATSGAPARATDADTGTKLVNASVYVSEGTTLADTQWTCTTNAPITVGSTSLTFAQLATGGSGTVSSVDASGGVETTSGSAITSTGAVRGAHKINAQTGTSYAILSGDRGKHLTLSNAAAIAGTIAQAGTSGFEDGYFVLIENIGAGAFTLTPTTSTINGAASVTLSSGYSGMLFSDGTNYRLARISGGTAGKHSIPIMASGMAPSVVGGCAGHAAITSASNQPDIVTLDFDASTEEYAQFAIVMPKKWNEGTVTAKFLWSHAATTTNFAVIWGCQAVAVSDDDTIAASYGTAQTVSDTGGTTNDLYHSAETAAITIAGSPAAEDMVFFRVYRKAADGSDTLAVDARLHGVVIFITTDAETDA